MKVDVFNSETDEWERLANVWEHTEWDDEEQTSGHLSYPLSTDEYVRIYVKDKAGNKANPYPKEY